MGTVGVVAVPVDILLSYEAYCGVENVRIYAEGEVTFWDGQATEVITRLTEGQLSNLKKTIEESKEDGDLPWDKKDEIASGLPEEVREKIRVVGESKINCGLG